MRVITVGKRLETDHSPEVEEVEGEEETWMTEDHSVGTIQIGDVLVLEVVVVSPKTFEEDHLLNSWAGHVDVHGREAVPNLVAVPNLAPNSRYPNQNGHHALMKMVPHCKFLI